MATVSEVQTQPASGLNHIDAILSSNIPGWNFVAPARNTLTYSFSLAGGNAADIGTYIAAAPSAFNASQQAAATQALNRLSQITGITFQLVADGTQADLHFACADVLGSNVAGICSSTRSLSSSNGTVVSYTAESYVYLDTTDFGATNNAPSAGTSGYEVLLHELGHAMGLKHSFEGAVTLPGGQDNTSNTLMSYTHSGGIYSDYRDYDIAALMFLYGGDGLGGAWGVNASGRFLVGTSGADTLTGSSGDDKLEGDGGNDTIAGGGGTDTAIFRGLRSAYTITTGQSSTTVSGPDGTDTLTSVERAQFNDQTVTLAGGGANQPPTGAINLVGTPQQGLQLIATQGTLADPDGLGTFSYRWQTSSDGINWTNVAGATSSTITLAQAQVSLRMRAVVSYTDGAGNAETVNSAPTGFVVNVNDPPTGSLQVAGVVFIGSPLTLVHNLVDPDGLGDFFYKWQSSSDGTNWTDIAGANTATFSPTQAQVGLRLRGVGNYTDNYGFAEQVFSTATVPVQAGNAPPTGTLSIAGTPRQGGQLQVQNSLFDADGLGAISYRWQSSSDGNSWTDIGGAVADTYTPVQAEVGLRLRVVASYVDGKGNPETFNSTPTTAVTNLNDPPVGEITLSGTAKKDQVLRVQSAISDPDGLGEFSYRWQSSSNGTNWSDIAGATGSAYTLGTAEVGRTVRVIVSYTDGLGTAESVTSQPSATVTSTNSPPGGTLTINGTPTQGQPLTAAAALTDPDGLGTLSYRWQASSGFLSWTDIAGATGSSFTPTQNEVGKLIQLVVSYVDGVGNPESKTAFTTTFVANVNDAPTGTVTVSGSARPGQLLTATASLADVDGLGTISFEWQSSPDGNAWTTIANAGGPTFTLGAAQVGLRVRAQARYTDGQGTAETVPSAATALVLGVVNGGPNNDNLTGSSVADEINGLQGNDRINGGGGNDAINGGEGIDTAVYSRVRADYTVAARGTSVTALVGAEGSDTLQLVERVAFSDLSLAFDLSGNAGNAARILGIVFGRAAVANPAFAGIGIGFLDHGTGFNDLMAAALNVRLGNNYAPADCVKLLYQNLIGVDPSAADLATWLGAFTSGVFTPVTLAVAAANLDINAANIDLVGLADRGLPFVPMG